MKSIKLALAAAILSIGGASVAQELPQPTGPWHKTVELTEHGHVIGNPDADTTLTQFVGYSCEGCAKFARQGQPALDIAFIAQGRLRFEVIPVVRTPVDLTIAMLTQCGGPAKFKGNHAMFLRSQSRWLERANAVPRSQQAIWARQDRNARMNMASALDLRETMIRRRGFTAQEVNTCLSDDALARTLLEKSELYETELGIAAPPRFAINGELLEGVTDWATLYEALKTHSQNSSGADDETELGESAFDR